MADTKRHAGMADQSTDRDGLSLDGAHERFHRHAAGRSLKFGKRKLALQSAVEVDIVPQLVLAHRPTGVSVSSGNGIERLEDVQRDGHDRRIREFADMVLGQNPDSAGAHIQSLREQGIDLEAIYLQLIAPTARLLRQLWLDDKRDYADVTLGFWRLQQLLREFSAAFRDDAQKSVGLRSLLSPAPGEAQDVGYLMFGLVLIGEFFRRDGWDTWIEPDGASAEMTRLIRTEWFDVVEFLVGSEKRLDALAARIKSVRSESLNRTLGVIVCGPMFVERPELVVLVGGDMPASDPRDGVVRARSLIGAPQLHAVGA